MATASYQQPNDYNLVKDIRPFELPYENYMQEIATKTQYWKVGVDRMKSIYDQAVGLDPQYTQGKEYLKNFVSEATKNLDKISKSDLSIMDNSQQAARVFKPLYDVNNPFNAALMKDSQLNSFYKKQRELSDTYRTKDNGKEWNANNEFYYRDGEAKYQQDAQKGDYSTVDKNFQERKAFVPYYNYKDEVKDIIDMCKGYSQETQDVSRDPGYFANSSSKGCDPQRLALAFQTGLSDRAKQQIHIDGYTHFKGNEDVLLRKFNDISINNAKSEIDKLTLAISGLKAGKVGKAEQAKIDDYQGMLNIRQNKYKEALSDYNNMTKGNPLEYVKNNYDKLAGSIYLDDVTNNLGEAFRTDERKEKLLPNAVEMQQRKINSDLNHDVIMANVDHGYKMEEINQKGLIDYNLAKAKGEITTPLVGEPVNGVTTDSPNIPKITPQEFIETNVRPTEKASTDSYNELRQYIIDKYGQQNPDAVFTEDGLASFVNEHNGKDDVNKDPELKKLYDNFKQKNNDWRANIDYVRAIDAKVKREHSDLYDGLNLSEDKNKFDVVIKTGIDKGKHIDAPALSQKDMYNIMAGENVNGYSIKTHLKDGKDVGKALYYNGKEISTVFGDNDKIYGLMKDVTNRNSDNLSQINKFKTDVYTSKYYNNGQFTHADGLIAKDKSALDNTIKNNLGVIGGQNEKGGYRIVYRGKTGEDIYVQPLDKESQPTVSSGPTDDILARLLGTYHDAEKVKTPMGWAYKIPKATVRYDGLPSDYELNIENKNVERVSNLQTILESDPRMFTSSRVDSRDLPDGTVNITTRSGKTATVAIIRGASTGNTYTATIEGSDRVLQAPSIENLQLQLNRL